MKILNSTTKPAEKTNSGELDHPSYYNNGKIEVIDFILDQKLDFCLGNVIKYVCRAGSKPGASEADDLRKAMHYLMRKIEEVEA